MSLKKAWRPLVASLAVAAAAGCSKPAVEEEFNPGLTDAQKQQVSDMDKQLQNLIQQQVTPTMKQGGGAQGAQPGTPAAPPAANP